MFTGLIEATGRVQRVAPKGVGTSVTIETPKPLAALKLGESVAVNGTCLTVTGMRGRQFTGEVSPEPLRRTTLGKGKTGDRVNLERALRLGDRLGGHIVQGHVDGVRRVAARGPQGGGGAIWFACPPG